MIETHSNGSKVISNDEMVSYIVSYPITWVSRNSKVYYMNVPCGFDIETTSTLVNGEKIAFMYEWTFGFNDRVTIGRTWQEYINFIEKVSMFLNLSPTRVLLCYVHNLSFEFQFIRKYFTWERVFALKERTPIYATGTNGVEYRCSYILSGVSLAKMASELKHHKIEKLKGNLDYTIVRHSKTPLTNEEIAYCINDVLIVLYYIQEQIAENDNSIANIVLTKTGKVRRLLKSKCINDKSTMAKVKRLTLGPQEYTMLRQAFQGGFTHASAYHSNTVVSDVVSYDFTSSYPYVMLSERFPMSKGKKVEVKDIEEFEKYIEEYCVLVTVSYTGLKARKLFENYISQSRCQVLARPTVNNGRIVSCDYCVMTITDRDYLIIKDYYSYDEIGIGDCYIYRKGYLPTPIVKEILDLYEKKTTLKNVQGKEFDYLYGKELLNSCYGMMVTDIIRDEITYQDDWSIDPVDVEESIQDYNSNRQRFLFYPWGVWVTAYARYNLFTGISEFENDYVYSDTDSIKVTNIKDHIGYINAYNANVENKLKYAMEYHGIPFERVKPKTIKGIEKLIGVWDFESHYKRFKTVGAKRYMVEYDDGTINITVSGLNKKTVVPYLAQHYKDPFKIFEDGLYIPEDYTGKLTHTYIDEPKQAIITDYKGIPLLVKTLSGVHLSGSDFTLGLSAEYLNFILSISRR